MMMTPDDGRPAVNLLALVPDLKIAPHCRGCNFTISLMPAHQRKAGKCLGCMKPVCFFCGCTEELPCAIAVIGGFYPCSWYAPGTCNVCFERILDAAYQNVCRLQAGQQLRDDVIERLVGSGGFEEVRG